MANEQIIIEYVLHMLDTVKTEEMGIKLNVLAKLLKKFPSYQWDDVINAVCVDVEEDKVC